MATKAPRPRVIHLIAHLKARRNGCTRNSTRKIPRFYDQVSPPGEHLYFRLVVACLAYPFSHERHWGISAFQCSEPTCGATMRTWLLASIWVLIPQQRLPQRWCTASDCCLLLNPSITPERSFATPGFCIVTICSVSRLML